MLHGMLYVSPIGSLRSLVSTISHHFLPALILVLVSFSCYAVLSSYTFMEVVKSAAKHGSTCRENIAIRANQKSHSYLQLISSALKISDLLTSSDLQTVCPLYIVKTEYSSLIVWHLLGIFICVR